MRWVTRALVSKWAGFGLVLVWGVWLSTRAQPAPADITKTLLEKRMYLVDLRNDGYWVTFPRERREQIVYSGLADEYGYSVVAPDGASLFAVKLTRELLPSAELVRRSLAGEGGPEETISSAFKIIQYCAVSRSERFVAIAGRLRGSAPSAERDGIYVLNRDTGSVVKVAGFANAGLNESILSLNVSDRGDVVVYEERGDVVRLDASRPASGPERHRGQFPVLMPGDQAYIFADHGWLLWKDGSGSRELVPVPKVAGGVRVSPDGHFVAFGVSAAGDLDYTRLRVCDLDSRSCVDGPKYVDWVAGRETFWIQR